MIVPHRSFSINHFFHSLQVTIKTNLWQSLSTKHRTKSLSHQTGNYPVTCFVSRPSGITLVKFHSLQVTIKISRRRGNSRLVKLDTLYCKTRHLQLFRSSSRGNALEYICYRPRTLVLPLCTVCNNLLTKRDQFPRNVFVVMTVFIGVFQTSSD